MKLLSECHQQSSQGFAKIWAALETVVIAMTKEGIRFSTIGDIGTVDIVCRQNASVDKREDAVIIEMQEPITLTFALRYMKAFTKGTPLSEQVTINISSDLPVVVEYKVIEMGYIGFYLAPKIEDEEVDSTAPALVPAPKPKKEIKPKVETKPKVEKAKEETDLMKVINAEEEDKTLPESNPKEEPQVFEIDGNADDKYVIGVGTTMVKEAVYTTKVDTKNTVGELIFVKQKEAFAIFFKKSFAGRSSAELLAKPCVTAFQIQGGQFDAKLEGLVRDPGPSNCLFHL